MWSEDTPSTANIHHVAPHHHNVGTGGGGGGREGEGEGNREGSHKSMEQIEQP